ncbi:MAG: hypothetical protein ACTSP4_06690, partial [Candidatus Hodarchaeales archaeon]
MSSWVTEKKPPLFLIALLGLQLLAAGLIGVLLLYSSLSAGTDAQNYSISSGMTLLFTTLTLGLMSLFFLRRSTNLFGGGGITLITQLLYGYWGFSGPSVAYIMMGSEGESLYSSYFVMGALSIFITASIVVIRVMKEDRDYVSKTMNIWPSVILTIILRFPAIYSFMESNSSIFLSAIQGRYGITLTRGWPLSLPATGAVFDLVLVGFNIYWLFQIPWFLVFHVGIYILRSLQEKILQWLDSGIAANFYNIVPTLIILFLVMGASFLESFQFGAPRHRLSSDLPEYIPQDIDWSTFNTDFWDASYILDSLLDQFTAGLDLPDEPLFNITACLPGTTTVSSTPKEPLAYWWRQEVYSNYGYEKNPSSTFGRSAWDLMPVDYKNFGATSYGQPPDNPNATYRVDFLANKAEDQTIWSDYIPATWNGPTGSYVSSISSPTDALVQEVSPDGVNPNYKDSLGIWATASLPAGTTTDTLTYYSDFRFSALDFLTASLGSEKRTSTNYIASLLDMGFDESTANNLWDTIEQAYLQIPTAARGELPSGVADYASWAPTAAAWANNLS